MARSTAKLLEDSHALRDKSRALIDISKGIWKKSGEIMAGSKDLIKLSAALQRNLNHLAPIGLAYVAPLVVLGLNQACASRLEPLPLLRLPSDTQEKGICACYILGSSTKHRGGAMDKAFDLLKSAEAGIVLAPGARQKSTRKSRA